MTGNSLQTAAEPLLLVFDTKSCNGVGVSFDLNKGICNKNYTESDSRFYHHEFMCLSLSFYENNLY